MTKNEYHKRVRDLGCVACHSYTIVIVHHFGFGSSKRIGWQGHFLVIPLCDKHHREVHAGKKTFYEKYEIDPYAEAAKIYVRLVEGNYATEAALKRLTEVLDED